MLLISIQSSSHGKLVQTNLFQTFSNDKGKILPSTNLKDTSKVAANGLLMHSLEKSIEQVTKLFNVENLPATLELRAPLKVTLNYVTLEASIEAFQKLQAYICVPKISSHVGSLSFSQLYSLHQLELSEFFSLLANSFGDKQDNSLEDYVEASIMLRVNSAMCFYTLTLQFKPQQSLEVCHHQQQHASQCSQLK